MNKVKKFCKDHKFELAVGVGIGAVVGVYYAMVIDDFSVGIEKGTGIMLISANPKLKLMPHTLVRADAVLAAVEKVSEKKALLTQEGA